MDYKELYLEKYNPAFQFNENWIQQKLIEYKQEQRTYASAEKKIRQSLNKDYSAIPPKNQVNFYYEIARTFEKLKPLYPENSLTKIFSNEIKDLYEENNILTIESYEGFVQSFANFNAIFDVHNFYGRISKIIKIYYERDELNKFKLEPIKHYREYSDFNRLVKLAFPDVRKFNKDKIEIDLDGQFIMIDEDNVASKNVTKSAESDVPVRFLANEKFLLLDIFYKLMAEPSVMKRAEFSRLIIIVGDILDPGLLEAPSIKFSRNTSYNNFKGNIELKPKNVQIDILSSLEVKLEKYLLPEIKASLKKRLRKIKKTS